MKLRTEITHVVTGRVNVNKLPRPKSVPQAATAFATSSGSELLIRWEMENIRRGGNRMTITPGVNFVLLIVALACLVVWFVLFKLVVFPPYHRLPRFWQIREKFRLALNLREKEPRGYNRLAAFEQDTWWQTRDHRFLRLTEMTKDHRKNLLVYLERNYGVPRTLQQEYGRHGWLHATKLFLGVAYLVRIDGTLGDDVWLGLEKAVYGNTLCSTCQGVCLAGEPDPDNLAVLDPQQFG